MFATECRQELGESCEDLRRRGIAHRQREELVNDPVNDKPQQSSGALVNAEKVFSKAFLQVSTT